MEKCIIVAVADNRAIGENGTLPWHISEDLKFFKRTTMGSPVIMGRKTFSSLGRPLPGRKNIVLSRSVGADFCGDVVVVPSMEEAYKAAEPSERCFVIGGATVYALSLHDADRLFVTEVHTTVENADAFFPEIDKTVWKEVSRSAEGTDPLSGIRFEFVEYERMA